MSHSKKIVRYETLMLTRTEITNEEISMLEKSIEKIVTVADGTMDRFDKWGKYRLAYPVEKHDYGIYILARYTVPSEKIADMVKELAQFFRITCNEIVMRHVNVRLDDSAPDQYAKPDPVDTAGTGSVDAFLKEHKIDSMIDLDDHKDVEKSDINSVEA
ncbi:30S ribosomal protein S6 [Candidatus Dependentiae bacterium]|nr:MAG: 30S ribosomal protein S6 [Candidatus Dependentiae bacterium]